MTQNDLADALDVSQGLISKIEHGFRAAPNDLLAGMSAALSYPIDFFCQDERVYGLGIGELFHRKRQDVPVKVLLRIHATVNIWRMHLNRLLKGIELPECRIPNVDLADYDQNVEDVARFIRAHWKLAAGPIPNLCTAIEDAGAIVIAFDFGTSRVDAISHWSQPLPPLFFVNSRAPTDRMRFSLAHELGHMLIHQSSHAYFELTDTSEAEQQANVFAAELLMPVRTIAHQLTEASLPKLAMLKGYWKVSMSALLKRASDLGSISDRRAKTLWTELSKRGYREPKYRSSLRILRARRMMANGAHN